MHRIDIQGTPPTTSDELRDVKLAFITARERGESLMLWIERYPQHARVLAELALALDTGERRGEPSENEINSATRALEHALSHVTGTTPSPSSPGLVARAQSLGMAIPFLAQQLQLGLDIVYQIDRGFIRLETLPSVLIARLSSLLKYPVEESRLGLVSPQGAALYYADHKPELGTQHSFAQAVRDSELLADADRALWLAIVEEEGLLS